MTQYRLKIPKNTEFYDEPVPSPTSTKIFKAIPIVGKWIAYSQDIEFVTVGRKVRSKERRNIMFECTADNIDRIKKDARLELVSELLIPVDIAFGQFPQQLVRNKPFTGIYQPEKNRILFVEYI